MFAWRAFRRLVEQVDESNRRLDGTLAGLDRTIERNSRLHEQIVAELREGRDQIRANTEATWRMLDKWDEGQNPA